MIAITIAIVYKLSNVLSVLYSQVILETARDKFSQLLLFVINIFGLVTSVACSFINVLFLAPAY